MPRKPKPWWWEKRKLWCVNIDRARHILGEHPSGSAKPRKNNAGLWNVPREIDDAYHKLMAAPQQTKVGGDTVAAVLDDFLTWCYENRANRTADRYKDFIQQFVDVHGRLSTEELNAGHVQTWLNGKPTWNSTTKHNAITALMRGFNWAVKNRGIRYNPIKGMEKPKPNRRTTVVSPEEFDELLGHVRDQLFRDLLIVSYDSGARPQEIKELEARHVELDKQRAVIPADEAKKGIQRAFYFPTDRSMEIIKRLIQERPEGFLFLNNRGNPWTGFAVKCRFARLEEKVGKRFSQYTLRHTWITRKLAAGVDSHVVAKLSGHQNTAMLDRHYSHIADDYDFMLKEAKKGEDASAEGSEDET